MQCFVYFHSRFVILLKKCHSEVCILLTISEDEECGQSVSSSQLGGQPVSVEYSDSVETVPACSPKIEALTEIHQDSASNCGSQINDAMPDGSKGKCTGVTFNEGTRGTGDLAGIKSGTNKPTRADIEIQPPNLNAASNSSTTPSRGSSSIQMRILKTPEISGCTISVVETPPSRKFKGRGKMRHKTSKSSGKGSPKHVIHSKKRKRISPQSGNRSKRRYMYCNWISPRSGHPKARICKAKSPRAHVSYKVPTHSTSTVSLGSSNVANVNIRSSTSHCNSQTQLKVTMSNDQQQQDQAKSESDDHVDTTPKKRPQGKVQPDHHVAQTVKESAQSEKPTTDNSRRDAFTPAKNLFGRKDKITSDREAMLETSDPVAVIDVIVGSEMRNSPEVLCIEEVAQNGTVNQKEPSRNDPSTAAGNRPEGAPEIKVTEDCNADLYGPNDEDLVYGPYSDHMKLHSFTCNKPNIGFGSTYIQPSRPIEPQNPKFSRSYNKENQAPNARKDMNLPAKLRLKFVDYNVSNDKTDNTPLKGQVKHNQKEKETAREIAKELDELIREIKGSDAMEKCDVEADGDELYSHFELPYDRDLLNRKAVRLGMRRVPEPGELNWRQIYWWNVQREEEETGLNQHTEQVKPVNY